MKELDLSVEILSAVLDGTEFGTALKDKFQKEVEIRPLRHDVASLVGCALRHSILFSRLLDKVEGLEESDKRIVMIGMANNYFCRRYEKKDMDEAIKGLLGEEKAAIALPILDKEGEENRYMPDDVDHSSLDYLSLRYNAPIWACKILHHFGYSNTFKTLKKWARPYVTYVRFRDLPELDELRTSPDFAATSIKDVYLYAGKKPLRVYEEYRRGKIFEVRPRVKELLDSHVISAPSSALLYCGKLSGGAELELVEHYGDALAMNIATSELDSKLALTRLIREKGLHNVNLFQTTDPTAMDASVPGKQQLVICLPDSTAFDQVPTSPDFLLHFDKDAMDGIISGEQKALEGCAKYVDDGGKLIYAILTISKKEGHLAVESFLQNHQEFTLVEEKQCFPYDELGTAVYYAVLSRGAEVDKIPAPLGELSALKEMSSEFEARGQSKYRAKQVFAWIYVRNVLDFDSMSDVSKAFREELKSSFTLSLPRIAYRQDGKDGTIKLLLEMEDGAKVETVMMPYDYGCPICVSSEVGCSMGCAFCASGLHKRERGLTAAEMVGELLVMNNVLREYGRSVTHINVMGTGEPFDNYDNVMDFIRIANCQFGLAIGARHITVSTCGLTEGIKRYGKEGLQTNLALSLHAPNDEIRNKIMPISRAFPMDKLFEALQEYGRDSGRRVTLEYILLSGINDSDECARELAALIRKYGVFAYVNLIPYNEVKEMPFKRASNNRVHAFHDLLLKLGINATVRKEWGEDIDAACGQLRAKTMDKKEKGQ